MDLHDLHLKKQSYKQEWNDQCCPTQRVVMTTPTDKKIDFSISKKTFKNMQKPWGGNGKGGEKNISDEEIYVRGPLYLARYTARNLALDTQFSWLCGRISSWILESASGLVTTKRERRMPARTFSAILNTRIKFRKRNYLRKNNTLESQWSDQCCLTQRVAMTTPTDKK